jgi:hypothetical protein
MKSSSFQVRLPFRTKVSSSQFRNLVRAFANAPRPLVDPGPGPYASNFRCDPEELQDAAELAHMSRTSLARALLNGAAKIAVQSALQKSSSAETATKLSIFPQPADSTLIAEQNPAPQPKAAPHAPQKSNFKSSRPTENIQQTELRKTQVPAPVRPTTPPPAPSLQDEVAALQRARSIPEATRIHTEQLRQQGWHVTDDGIATRIKSLQHK